MPTASHRDSCNAVSTLTQRETAASRPGQDDIVNVKGGWRGWFLMVWYGVPLVTVVGALMGERLTCD